ncbi:hypothetical protein ACFE04_014958 [Oxalis oulophora]
MSVNLHSPFLGTTPLCGLTATRNRINNSLCWSRRRQRKRTNISCEKQQQHPWISRLSHFCGQNVELLRKAIVSKNGLKVECVKEEPLTRSHALVKSLSPLWEEGLLLIRCSVVVAVISGVCLLVLYGQSKTKSFIEAKILPSICSVLSEHIQREIDFGKVHSVSPLSITLESCSIGPHDEEFSCGEIPTMKIRVRPFSSLRRGTIVIDAMLSHPNLLVSQKKDYSWLGIPPPPEDGLFKHLSSEEGIDYRTKTRRIAREQVSARWDKDRDDSAREAAEIGYVVFEKASEADQSETDFMKEGRRLTEIKGSDSFLYKDEEMSMEDHHCMDTGVNYDIKHAHLEKSFGVKTPGSGLKFWSKEIKGPTKRKLKGKADGSIFSETGGFAKKRILDRSAVAAADYFHRLSVGSSGELSQSIFVNSDSHEHVHEASEIEHASGNQTSSGQVNSLNVITDPFLMFLVRLKSSGGKFTEASDRIIPEDTDKDFPVDDLDNKNVHHDLSEGQNGQSSQNSSREPVSPSNLRSGFLSFSGPVRERLSMFLADSIQKLKADMLPKVEDIVSELADDAGVARTDGIQKMIPVTLDSVQFKNGTLMLLAYGDREPREMENVNGILKFQNHYGRVHVQLNGNCKTWRSDEMSRDGGWLSADVFVDVLEQNWHANLKIANLFAPLFERLLEIPIAWSKGRATGEVHICMSRGDKFPNLQGQLDVTGLAFQILDAPSSFSEISSSLRLQGQRVFVHNASGSFGDIPVEASGDFGINPEEGEFHLVCQVPCVEVNALMKSFKMKPLLFPLAGSVTAVFNCQGPLDAPIFIGSGMVTRKVAHSLSDIPLSSASEAMLKSKEAGAVAAFDRVPFSYLSANFTFNTDNCVADLYGIRASLVDGGEIRGAGNAWICPEGEVDDAAVDVNFSGNFSFDKVMERYMPGYHQLLALKLGDISGETKFSGSLVKPKFDIKWIAPKAEGSLTDARGDILISHDCITVSSSSTACELYTKIHTSYLDEWLTEKASDARNAERFVVEGVDLDLRMRGFEFFSLVSYPFDSPRPTHLKASGKIKFQGKVLKPDSKVQGNDSGSEKKSQNMKTTNSQSLAGEVSLSGFKVNQLMIAPQLVGLLSISHDHIKLEATGRPDETLALEVVGPLQPSSEENAQNGKLLSFSLQKGQLRANVCFRPQHLATLEVRHLPLDELELASLRGNIQRAEIQLNLQKRKGHGMLSVLKPKFSGVLGEALDVAARWSGDVITIEKSILEQTNSRYELQGEYVLPGSRDRNLAGKEMGNLFKRAMAGHLGTVISSMGRWRMRLEVPRADVAEMLPLARLLSRSTDPAVRSRSKDFFIQNLPSVGLCSESLQELLDVIQEHYTPSSEVIHEEISLPGLAELRGRWHGSLDASGGGNGDTMVICKILAKHK